LEEFVLFFLALSFAAHAKPPKRAAVEETVPSAPKDPGYTLTSGEMELMGFMTDHCPAPTGPESGMCSFTVSSAGLVTIMAPEESPCVPDLPTDSCSPPVAVGFMNAGNPFRTAATRMGCSDLPSSFILCSVYLAIPPDMPFEELKGFVPTLSISSRKAGADKDLESYSWSFSPEKQTIWKF
jgi:hypothetical protein